jgi:hypothetical protein
MSDETYSIVRFHAGGLPVARLATGLTIEEAREWCEDPETSSRTCKLPKNIAYTEKHGAWFDGYTEE